MRFLTQPLHFRLAPKKRHKRDSKSWKQKGFNEKRLKGSRPKWRATARSATTAETAEMLAKTRIPLASNTRFHS